MRNFIDIRFKKKNQTLKITMQNYSLLIKKNSEQNMKRQKVDIRIMIDLPHNHR